MSKRLNIDAIREIILAKGTFQEIAARFGTSYATVSNCKNGRTGMARYVLVDLEHVGTPVPKWNGKRGKRRFSDSEVVAIRASTEPSPALGRALGVAPSTIRDIRRGRTYKEVQ